MNESKVDLPLSVIKLLAKHLQVSVAYLADGVETEWDEDATEMLRIFMSLKSDAAKKVALEQMKLLQNI